MMKAADEAEKAQTSIEMVKSDMENEPARVIAMTPTESESNT